MKVVKVYGALRKKLGQCRFQFDVDTPAQAFKALCVNFPGLDRWLIDSEQEGVGYRLTIGKEKINESNAERIIYPWSEQEVFSITPVIAGAGGNAGTNIAIGVGLVFASFLFPGAGLFGTVGLGGGVAAGATAAAGQFVGSAFLTGMGVALSGLGASLVLTGISQAISPAPVMSGAGTNPMERGREAAKFESFTFSGIVNTAKQGLPVPIAYGRCFVGSAVLSSGLDVDQIL